MIGNSKNHAFCTLYEGDYHHGVAALLNSLVAAGFTGTFIIGWRGAPPPWQESLKPHADGSFSVQDVRVIFERVETPWLLAHIKPRFMLEVLQRIVPDAISISYADPDIVMDAPWSFYEKWMTQGVAICEDCCFPSLASNHYLRRCWKAFARDVLKIEIDDTLSRGFNSGFVALMRKDLFFLETWKLALGYLPSIGVPLEQLKPGTRLDSFFGTDQDTLNIAAMAHSSQLSSLGTEGMGFTRGMNVMWHAVAPLKPWRRNYLVSLICNGHSIELAHRHYWHHASGPVKSWTPVQLRLRLLNMRIAIVLSRFYHSA